MSIPRFRILTVALVAVAALSVAGVATSLSAGAAPHGHRATLDKHAFSDDMRKLWEDHVTWTRMFIVEAAAGSAATDATAARLLRNQDDIGDAIKPFYGEAAGEQLSTLLREHILIAADILTAAKQGDQSGVTDGVDRWHANADEIADFLSSANPKRWPAAEMRTMMREHLDLTLAEAVARLNGDFDADIAAYDELHVQILHMSDMLSSGIVAQFPRRFR